MSAGVDDPTISDGDASSEPDSDEVTTWDLTEQSELSPGYFAWDLLSIGRRFETWIAWCADRLTPVCIKIPRSDQMDDRTMDALRREYRTASSLSHPAIPRVFAADLDAVRPYLVYEFIEGKPLSMVIEDDGPYDSKNVVFLGLQLAAALRHMHNRGFVHLDVKPSNVSMRADRAVLLDFDIALPVGGQRSTVTPRGTHYYMAPEQIRCEPAHPSMDLFALGALLYEAASGEVAFALSSADERSDGDQRVRVFRQVGEPIAPVGVVVPDLEPAVAAVVDSLLAVDVNMRPATADEAIQLLVAALPNDVRGLWPAWVDTAVIGRAVDVSSATPDGSGRPGADLVSPLLR